MNKKMFALLVVPVFLIASGALAYSAFSGNALTNVSAKAGSLTFDESGELAGFYAHNTNMTLVTGYGSHSVTIPINESTSTGLELGTVPYNGYTSVALVYYVNLTNLAPGNWVNLTLTIANGGTVGFIVGTPSVGTALFSPSSASSSSQGLNLTDLTGHANLFSGPLSGVHGTGYLYATNYGAATGSSVPGLTGYAFDINSLSGFHQSLDHNDVASFNVAIGLSSGAGNNYQESSISIPIVVTIESDP